MKTPFHLWIIGGIALIWNAFGCFDYVMTKTKNAAYMGQFTPEQAAYFYSFPLWVNICWAIAVWSALLGSILLLMRMKLAVPVFALSFFTMCATTLQNYVLADVKMIEITGQASLILAAIIFAVAILLWLYARRMGQKGTLS